MHRRHKYDIIVILAVLGAGISLYLAVTHYLGFVVPCNLTHGCESVLNSKYSMLFGLPLSVWGVAYFLAVVVSALMSNHYLKWQKVLTAILALGGVAALIFLSLQFFVIKRVCQYCLSTDLLSILLFVLDINIEPRS